MDIVKVKNISYAKYEEVLLRRDNLRKEAEKYHLEFIREFGDLITESFRLKIECIKKKKMIAYCQRMVNQGKDINGTSLNNFIEREMAEYNTQLEAMLQEVKAVNDAEDISPMELKKIKDIYYALVKLMHPDTHPELASDETLKDYWQRIVIAYRYNNLKDLEELDVLVRSYLESKESDGISLEIENIDKKIAAVEKEIEEIISTEPYLYKVMLADKREVEERKQEYRDEIEAFTNYSAQLQEVLDTFEIKEMLS